MSPKNRECTITLSKSYGTITLSSDVDFIQYKIRKALVYDRNRLHLLADKIVTDYINTAIILDQDLEKYENVKEKIIAKRGALIFSIFKHIILNYDIVTIVKPVNRKDPALEDMGWNILMTLLDGSCQNKELRIRFV